MVDVVTWNKLKARSRLEYESEFSLFYLEMMGVEIFVIHYSSIATIQTI